MNIHDVAERGTSPPDPLYASSGSLSSSVSLSDRSASTDCVEEFVGDMPFAGEYCLCKKTKKIFAKDKFIFQ